MSTLAGTVGQIRRILGDTPLRLALTAAITDTTTATFSVGSSDAPLFGVGQTWEHDDGGTAGAERRKVYAVDETTPLITAYRGWDQSTAATHLSGSFILLDPYYPYDLVAQAIQTVLDADFESETIYDIIEHQITSSTTTNSYDAPTAACEEFLSVFMKPSTAFSPIEIRDFTRYPTNTDITLYSTGKFFWIGDNAGTPGTDVYYVNCRHALTATTLTATQDRIVQALAAAHLLDWKEPRRLAGPTTQGDRTVPTLAHARMAAGLRAEARRLMVVERSRLRTLVPPVRVFVKGD